MVSLESVAIDRVDDPSQKHTKLGDQRLEFLIVESHHPLEIVNLFIMHVQPITFTEDLLESLEADSMSKMLIHRPAFQIMKMFCSSLVPFGEICLLAFRALVQYTGAGYNLSVD